MRLARLPVTAVIVLLALAARSEPLESKASCLPELSAAEAKHHLPPGLLLSMALVESGRRDPVTGVIAPWPWTIQTMGEGHFYESPADAIRDAKAHLRAGNALIDVGCLQVDLFHHPHAFRTLDAAFDPAANIDYAAGYLAELAHARGSWLEAIAVYNAGNPTDGLAYLAKVLHQWKGMHLPVAAAIRHPAFIVTLP